MKYGLSELTSIIKDRRTIYPEAYSGRKVHPEIVNAILNNAIWAPTHGRTEPWRFKVYMEEGRQKLAPEVAELYKQTTPVENFKEHVSQKLITRITTAPVVILVWMERGEKENIPTEEEQAAVACAMQNMMLTCTAYGLGSFWSTPKLLYSDLAKERFQLKQEDRIMGLFYIGYTDQPWPKSHRKPLEYVTEWITE